MYRVNYMHVCCTSQYVPDVIYDMYRVNYMHVCCTSQ